MSDEIQGIINASNWSEYYEAYKRAYRAVIEFDWALGAATFAQQLHHTAVPDVAGTTAALAAARSTLRVSGEPTPCEMHESRR
jgi:hypothetical protein